MADLLKSGVLPKYIMYFTGEVIDDHHSLVSLIMETLEQMPNTELRYLLLDVVTYIRQWDKGIKYLADAGIFKNTVMLLTGSDLVVITIRAWLSNSKDPYKDGILPLMSDSNRVSKLA